MKKMLLAAWLCVLAGMFWADVRWAPIYRAHEAVAARTAVAAAASRKEDWETAAAEYENVLASLPDDDAHRTARIQAELALNAVTARTGRQAESIKALDDLLQRFDGDPAVTPTALDDVRRELGVLHYYNAWAMRVRNAPAAVWSAEAERGRQQFRYVAGVSGGADRDADARNVERVLRLERLNLSELRGRPLPKEAQSVPMGASDKMNDDQSQQTKPMSSDIASKSSLKKDGRPGGAGLPSRFEHMKGS